MRARSLSSIYLSIFVSLSLSLSLSLVLFLFFSLLQRLSINLSVGVSRISKRNNEKRSIIRHHRHRELRVGRVHFLLVSIIPRASRRVFDKFDTRLPGREGEEKEKQERKREC